MYSIILNYPAYSCTAGTPPTCPPPSFTHWSILLGDVVAKSDPDASPACAPYWPPRPRASPDESVRETPNRSAWTVPKDGAASEESKIANLILGHPDSRRRRNGYGATDPPVVATLGRLAKQLAGFAKMLTAPEAG
jgi:hypothetical protein